MEACILRSAMLVQLFSSKPLKEKKRNIFVWIQIKEKKKHVMTFRWRWLNPFFCIRAFVYNKSHIRGHVWPLPKLEMSHLFSEKRDCSLSINPHGDPAVSSEVITAPKTVSVSSNISEKNRTHSGSLGESSSLSVFRRIHEPVRASDWKRCEAVMSWWVTAAAATPALPGRGDGSLEGPAPTAASTAWPRVRSLLTPADNLVFDSGGGINDNIKKNIKRFGKTCLVKQIIIYCRLNNKDGWQSSEASLWFTNREQKWVEPQNNTDK